MTPSVRGVRRALVVGVVGVALLVAQAVPASATTTPEDWGETFCTETVNWLSGAAAGANELSAQAEDPDLTPAQGKALIVEYLATGVSATKSFGRSLERVGAPKTGNGARIQAAVLAGIAGSGAELAVLLKLAKALPTGSPTAFSKGATKLGNKLASFSEPFQKGLDRADRLDKGNALGDVLESLPACSGLADIG